MTKRFTLNSKLLFLSLLFLIIGHTVLGQQIYFHNFENGNLNNFPYNAAPPTFAPNLSNSSWTNSSGAWTTFGGNTGQAIVTQSGNVVITLTFNVATNYQVAITSFNFWGRRTTTGPQNWAMTINGINVGNGAGISTGGAFIGNTNVANTVSGLTGTVTVVLTLTGASGTGNFRLDDFELQGSVTQACTPPVVSSHSPNMGPKNTLVTIYGSGFLAGSGTSAVKLSGVNVTSFTVISDTEIIVNTPPGSISGLFSVTTNGCETSGVMYFAVIESTGSSASNLYISELYDAQAGSGGVIELYNGTASPINLAGYTIRRYGNIGDTTPTYEITLSGTVAAGGIYLIGIGSPIPCGAVTGTDFATGFNDGDRLELVQNGILIDTVETPDNTGFTMIRNPNAEAPKVVFNGSDWNSSNSENCNNVGLHTTTVTPSPTMATVNIPLACENGEVTFSATLSNSTGYTYQWKILDNTGAWINVTDTGSYSGSNTGTLMIDPVLMSFDNNQYYCVATSATNTVVSNADQLEVSTGNVPVTDFTYTTPICVNSSPVMPIPAAGFTAGGTFTSDAGLSINATTGQINVGTSTAGSHIITYSVPGSITAICSDAGSSTFTIQIDNSIVPETGFTYPTPNCVGGASISPTLNAGFTPGGTFTSNANLSINSMTGQINIAGSTSGFHTILYSVTADPATCRQAGSSTFTIQISNSGAPIVEFSYPSATVCTNSAPIFPVLAPGFVSGGTFSSDTGLTINSATGEITISTSTVASHSIIYTLPADPASCQAAGADFFTIQIVNPSVPVTGFSYTTPVCTTSAPITPTPVAGFVSGGTYTSDAGLSINATTGAVNVGASTPGPHTITYTVAADLPNCNQGGSSTFAIQINSATTPVTDFTYTTPICGNNAAISPIPGPGFTSGGVYTSDAGLSINASNGAINIGASTTGSHIITYTIAPSSCNTGGSDTFTILINPVLTPVTNFSYPTPVCSDSAPVNPIPATGFTAGGSYTSDAGLSINATTGEINIAASTAGSHTITYTINPDPATCNVGGTSTANIIINAVFTPVTSFSYTTPVCGNSPSISPVPAAGFVTGGTYTSDAGLSINASTGAINVAGSTTGSHTITYTINPDLANCNSGGSDTFTIFITPVVTPVTSFTYPTPVCSDSAPINPIPGVGFTPGGTYTSDAGLSINPATGNINVVGSTTGQHIVTYTINPDLATCNVGGSHNFTVVINTVFTPVTAFTYTTPICPDSAPVNPIPAAGFVGGGTFTSDAGLSINPATGQINVTASTVGSHTITYTILPNAAACNLGSTDTFTVSIDAASAIAPITGATAVCVGETIQLSNATPGGTWSSSDTSVATVDNTGLVTGVTSNYVDIIYTVNNTCIVSVSSNITVFANPNPLLEDKFLCVSNTSGTPYNSVLLECGIPNTNFSFVWTLNGAPLPTTTNAHLATALGVYEVTVTNTVSGCVNTTSCTVSASSTAVATATVGEDFNKNQIITVDVTGGSGDYLFQLDHGVPQESNVFPFAHQGEYTITIIDKNGCQDLVLTVFALNYPRFFTPNGDNYNDTWGIKGLTDLNAKTYIFDRFGKLVKYLNAFGEEWDGTLNGEELPSTDYWFLLEYKDRDGVSKEFRSHFSLKR